MPAEIKDGSTSWKINKKTLKIKREKLKEYECIAK